MTETIIIGAGFGGICMGAQLRESGRDDFLILEKADGVGGAWRENTYPGAECDIASAYYSFSFAQNPTWDFKWAKQKQILKYTNDCADKFGLRPHLRFGVQVMGADYADGIWTVHLAEGEPLKCRFLVSAIGQLHHPSTPNFEGLDHYQGPSFHSASWDHSVEMKGRKIGVIGNAASAIQLIPELAEQVDELTVYHRSPNWIVPKGDRPYTALEKWLGKAFPPLTNLYRFNLFAQGEYGMWPAIQGNRLAQWELKRRFKKNLHTHVKDPELRAILTPDYPLGAKRVLLSDRIYPALARENVTVVSGGIERFTQTGIIGADGVARDHDAVVMATGFHTNPFLKEITVTGEGGVSLRERWKDGAYAYLGTTVSDFPNLFMLYGPNTNSGHTSIIFKLEQQVAHALQLMDRAGPGVITVKADAETAYNEEVQTRLRDLAWSKVEVSWYKDGDRITNNWMGGAREFKSRLRNPIWDHFDVRNI